MSAIAGAGMFRSLRVHDYRLWASGAIVSNVGTWMQRTTQDWIVLTRLTHHIRRIAPGAASTRATRS